MLPPKKEIEPEQRDEQDSNPRSSSESNSELNPHNESVIDETQGLNDMQLFFNRVKRELRNPPEIHIDNFKNFCERRRRDELMQRVSNLIRGDPEIIVIFDKMFPQYRRRPVIISVSPMESAGASLTLSTQQTIANPPTSFSEELINLKLFWNKVKNKFRNQPVVDEISNEFRKYRSERSLEQTVVQPFLHLILGCRRETIVDFNRLFPEYRINLDQRRPVIISMLPMESTGTSLKLSTQRTIANHPTARQDRCEVIQRVSNLFRINRGLIAGLNKMPEQRDEQVSNPRSSSESNSEPNPQIESANDETQELNDMQSFFNRVKRELRNLPEIEIDNFKNFCERRRRRRDELMQRVSNMIRGDRELIVIFNKKFPRIRMDPNQREPVTISGSSLESTGTSLPLSSQRTMANPSTSFSEELQNLIYFLNKVKKKLRNHPVVDVISNELSEYRIEKSYEHTVVQPFSHLILGCRRETIVDFNRLFPEYEIDPNQRRPVITSVSPMESTGTSLTLSTQQTIAILPTASSQKPEANAFIDQVQYVFRNQPEVYDEFITLARKMHLESDRTRGLVQRVADLFRDHPNLIDGFNQFLPPEYKIKVEHDEEMQVDEGSLPGSNEASLTSHSTTQQATVNPSNAASALSAESSSVDSSGA